MRTISAKTISETVAGLCLQANLILRNDVLKAVKSAHGKPGSKRSKNILRAIIKNAEIASGEKLPICQDTGLPSVFVELGQEVKIKGDLNSAINRGVELGYGKGNFRNSIVADPLGRGKPGYTPVVVHTDLVPGKRIKLTVMPKGFGCENKTQLRMFKPTESLAGVKKFIIEAVKTAGPDACPPYVVGVGIGGNADYACLLAKKALLKDISARSSSPLAARLEKELLAEINRLNIGPMGLGGKATALGVNILTYPTHIAGMPVAVSISCHALRSATKII